MLYFIYIILIIFGIVSYNRKIKISKNIEIYSQNIICFLMIFFATYITYRGINAPDYIIYKLSYDGVVNDLNVSTDSGYLFDSLCRLSGRFFGFDFRIFKSIIICFSFLILYLITKKHTKHTSYVMALLMLYPMLLLIVQFRYTLALVFLCLAIEFYLENSLIDKVLFLVFLIISAQLHSSMYFFAIFIILWFEKIIGKHYKSIIILMTMILIIFQKQIINIAKMFVSNVRLNTYLVQSKTGYLGLILYLITFYLNFKIAEAIYIYSKKNQGFNSNELKLITFNYKSKILVFLSIFLVMMTPDFLRISRSLYIYNYISVAILLDKKIKEIPIYFIKNICIKVNFKILNAVYIAFNGVIYILYFTPNVVTTLLGGL